MTGNTVWWGKIVVVCVLTHLFCGPVLLGADVIGELKQWNKITLNFEGPASSEDADPNPFLNYRMMVTFSNGDQTISVPGYFAADGNAAESGATAGNKWRCHFVPPETGEWAWRASFRRGPNTALNDQASAGEASGFDGESGTFNVRASVAARFG